MPPRRPPIPDDFNHSNTPRHPDANYSSRNDRHASSKTASVRSPKLEVSFLLNQAQNSAGNSASAQGSRPRSERKSQAPSGSGQRRFRCESCSATFAQSHDALKHKRFAIPRHSTCLSLLSMCRTILTLAVSCHQLVPSIPRTIIRTVHEKLRPFTCDICGKSFGEKGTCKY